MVDVVSRLVETPRTDSREVRRSAKAEIAVMVEVFDSGGNARDPWLSSFGTCFTAVDAWPLVLRLEGA